MSQSNHNSKIAKILSNFENLIAVMPGHVYWKDRSGVYLGCNEAQDEYVRRLGHKSFIGGRVEDFLPKEIADKVNADDNYVMSTGKELTVEEATPEGVVLSKKIPLKDETGEVVGMLGISFDISERKKQEHALETAKKQAELTLESLVANMPGHVFWMDTEGRYLGCNNEQAFTLGLKSRQEFIGKTPFDLVSPALAKVISETDLRILKTGKAETRQETGRYSDGREAIYLSRKTPIKDETGKIVGLLGVAFDITAEKEAEKLREEKLVVEESLKNAKLLAASIAHELRTPLATINSIAGNLSHYMVEVYQGYEIARAEHKVSEDLSPEVLNYLKSTPKSLSQVTYGANTFINMMLMKVNLENVKRHELTRLSAVDCLDESVKAYPINEEDQHLVRVSLEHGFDFMGDRTLFTHIIFNLLKNALYYVKAARKGEITMWFERGDDFNICHFKDTGKGMTDEVKSHLFSAFYSRTRHGTGVGLALCKLIMQEFGGTITCDSIENEYTHFKMFFPAIKPAAPGASHEH